MTKLKLFCLHIFFTKGKGLKRLLSDLDEAKLNEFINLSESIAPCSAAVDYYLTTTTHKTS